MLFMVVERFKDSGAGPIGERFRKSGRLLPEGAAYHASWVDTAGTRCFQLMEAPHAQLLEDWTRHWRDLVDFEIIPVFTSADFWANR